MTETTQAIAMACYAGQGALRRSRAEDGPESNASAAQPLVSTVTCPKCGAKSRGAVPSDSCVYLYTCPHCQETLKPLPGHCCIYCSYGDVDCPHTLRSA